MSVLLGTYLVIALLWALYVTRYDYVERDKVTSVYVRVNNPPGRAVVQALLWPIALVVAIIWVATGRANVSVESDDTK